MLSEFVSNEQAAGLSCHASSVAHLPGGRVIASWFSGSHEKSADVVIRIAVRSAEGQWSEPFVVADVLGEGGEPLAHWNPVLFVHGGVLTLYFKVGMNISRWRQFQTRASAAAHNNLLDTAAWSTPIELVPGPEGEAGRGAVRTEQIVVGGVFLAGG